VDDPMTVDLHPPGIDTDAVVRWLLGNVVGLAAPLTFTRIGEGQSNLTFRVDDDAGRAIVLRRPPLGEILESAHDMGREHHILSGLATAGMRAPRPLAMCDDASVTGTRFFVMEHVEGAVLTTIAAAEALPVAARTRASVTLAQTLARLQAVDIDAAGLGDLRRSTPYAARQLRRWHGQWQASRTRDLPAIDTLAERFATGLEAEREAVLVHGDFHLGNALVSPGGDVRTLLDWELCTVGHPLADVGLMVAYWGEMGAAAAGPDPMFREPVTALEGFPSADELVAAYAEASGRDVADVGRWIAFGYWRIAIIAEGVYRRWLNDPANGSGAAAVGAAVPRIARLAVDAADAAGL
jgi:aminoglycoside phosphotransferase (APT) family kinase protein